MAAISEQSLFNIIYALYEGDTTNWSVTSDEYLSARVYANAAINRWEQYDQTNWRELWGTLTSAATGDKTTTLNDWDYTCPSDMVKPASYVRTVNSSGNSIYWDVRPLAQIPSLATATGYFCYFTGNVKDGFTLHFNPNVPLVTGDTINYEYYKAASTLTTTTSTTEMADPYFIVYFVLSRFFENDGEDGRASKAFQEAESRLENMRTNNMVHLEGVSDDIEEGLGSSGFGY